MEKEKSYKCALKRRRRKKERGREGKRGGKGEKWTEP